MSIIFTDFWAFIAAILLLGALFDGIAKVVRAWKWNDKE